MAAQSRPTPLEQRLNQLGNAVRKRTERRDYWNSRQVKRKVSKYTASVDPELAERARREAARRIGEKDEETDLSF